MTVNTICVMGLGYVGLPTALLAARAGFKVIGFDTDSKKIEQIRNGMVPFQEPQLAERLREALDSALFIPVTTIPLADYFIIAVSTPCTADNKADLTQVWHAGKLISAVLEPGNCIVIESTVPVGTTQKFAHFISEQTGLALERDFYCTYCPERIYPGKAISELQQNTRIIGSISRIGGEKACSVYAPFVMSDFYITSTENAEFIKLIENSFRDINIAFAHEVAVLAKKLDINAYEAIELANLHPRVDILRPTCGVGGHCIPLDPWFLIQDFPKETSLLQSARAINNARPTYVLDEIKKVVLCWIDKHKKVPKVAVLGLTYKAEVDDLRNSPALFITQELAQLPYLELVCTDPYITAGQLAANISDKFVPFASLATYGLDIVVVLVAHSQFTGWLENIECILMDFCGITYKTSRQHYKDLFVPAIRASHKYTLCP